MKPTIDKTIDITADRDRPDRPWLFMIVRLPEHISLKGLRRSGRLQKNLF